mmetsp:Transcript_183174/g.445955  ORF Transcript_183174/g.445955 Transcript_183174/m.445955 type:complete len:272 (+) Transcript_183174:74-889(+)
MELAEASLLPLRGDGGGLLGGSLNSGGDGGLEGGLNGGNLSGQLLLLELGSGLGLHTGLLLNLLGVTVDEQIDHDIPGLLAGLEGAHAEDLTGENPVSDGDGVLALVVQRDGNIDTLQVGVSVAEGNDGHVDVGSLGDGLRVGAGVSADEHAGLQELLLDVVSEGTRGVATTRADHVGGAGVLAELVGGTLTVGAGRHDAHVLGVLDGHNDTGSEHQLLPGLGQVEDEHTVAVAGVNVLLHVGLAVLGTNVAVGGQHELDVFLSGGKDIHC